MQTDGKRAWSWQRALCGVSLALLGACGVAVLVIPPQPKVAVSLAARSNWLLSHALPTGRDFPNNWGYAISGPLRKTPVPSPAPSNTAPQPGPRAVYTTRGCTQIPRLLSHVGAALGPIASVDRYTELTAHTASSLEDDATGGMGIEDGPNARFEIWTVANGAAQIAEYLHWLVGCNTYGVTIYDYNLDGRALSRTVTTVVDEHPTDGAGAAVRVSRTLATADGHSPPLTYHVTYQAVRGLILQCSIFMDGADRDLVQRRAAETTQRLWAL